MGKKVGHLCKINLAANKIVGMGTWSLNGITADQLELTEFGDYWKTYEFGLKDGGTITFNGLFDPADITGQEVLRAGNLDNTDITNIRLYLDNTSYFEPCQTTSYWTPTDSTGNSSVLSHVNITSYDIGADKGGMMTIAFTAKVSGCMAMV